MMAAFAEFERSMIRIRANEGIAVAKREHPEKYKGRLPALRCDTNFVSDPLEYHSGYPLDVRCKDRV